MILEVHLLLQIFQILPSIYTKENILVQFLHLHLPKLQPLVMPVLLKIVVPHQPVMVLLQKKNL
ncbi:MAG: hypothetical protein EBR82_24795 [Caulobacteraceae bacterium]|nr:hypothetical protein [Caulobacteraceae bacterium]